MGGGGLSVHRGMWTSLDIGFQGILEALKELGSVAVGYGLVMCGHSLGGALALLLAHRECSSNTPSPARGLLGQAAPDPRGLPIPPVPPFGAPANQSSFQAPPSPKQG